VDKYLGLEDKIKNIGRMIYDASAAALPSLFDRRKWKGKVMEWAMRDETFKVNLFRFIDILPSIKSDTLIVRLLKEYFSDSANTPGLLNLALKSLPKRGPVPALTGKVIKANVVSLAKQFIAGKTPKVALKQLELLRKEGLAFSSYFLGEVVVSEKEAKDYTQKYLGLLNCLHPEAEEWSENAILDRDEIGPLPRIRISLKVSSFYSQLDPADWEGSIENTKENLRPVLGRAKEIGADVIFDMEHYYYKDITIAVFKSILEEEEFKNLPFSGIALQAYLKDTKEDLLKIIGWAKENKRRITIRLVKGAYWDYETVINRQKGWPVPVFLRKEETDHNYEELTKTIFENSSFVRPALASHNIRTISHAIAVADTLGLPREAFELQVLFGMAEPVREALQTMGYRVRVYTPVGELIPGMAYLVRRLLENTSNESFLRKSFVERTSFEDLIKAPRIREETVVAQNTDKGFSNESLTDFSKTENREKMKNALMRVKQEFNKRYPLYMGDKEVKTSSEIFSLNPANPQEVVGIVSSGAREEAENALSEAKAAWGAWKKVTPEERAGYLYRAAMELRKRRFELTALEVYEVGKTWKESDADVVEAIDYLDYYGNEMIRLGTTRRLGDYPGEQNEYGYEPKGIGVVISPWNFPLAIPAGMVSAAIVAGNCVILKPSGLSPVLGWWVVEVFRLAGLPPGILQFLPGPGKEVGEYLVSHPDIDFIAFTGSKDVGLRIVELAGKTLPHQRNVKKVIAEMGGKNGILVDETADIDEAVKGVLESALGYQGQKCSACSRIIVVGDVFRIFCDRLKEAMESIKIGPPEDPGSFMGPVIDKEALKKILDYIDIGKKEGKVVLLRKVDGAGYFIGPVLFTDVKPEARIAQEEIFGPLVSIMRANDIDDAIDIANNTLYALTGGIFSRSPANIRKVKDEMKVGNLYINRKITGAIVGRQPFGGFGMSGVGSKAGGPDYLLQFMNPKSSCENTIRRGFAPADL
jgi:RHH-type proline utilization regulon transcriptional repressor/proline dehydrogenase/delta 1-pyrroline-5-carboxylate dehydrogenase